MAEQVPISRRFTRQDKVGLLPVFQQLQRALIAITLSLSLLEATAQRAASFAGDRPKANWLQPGAVLKTPADRRLSPFTGYNRSHWLEVTEKLLAGVLPYFNTESGMPSFKGVPGSATPASRSIDTPTRVATG